MSALPVSDESHVSGFVVLVHDISFVERREEKAREFLLWAFGVLAVCASVVTLVAARPSWRRWSNELRRLLRGRGAAARVPAGAPGRPRARRGR